MEAQQNIPTFMTSADAILNLWLRHSPEWVPEAYEKCPVVNRVMKECARLETSKEEMLWRLCGALYEQSNHWRDTALKLHKKIPLWFVAGCKTWPMEGQLAGLPEIDPILTQLASVENKDAKLFKPELASTEDVENDRLYKAWNEPDKGAI